MKSVINSIEYKTLEVKIDILKLQLEKKELENNKLKEQFVLSGVVGQSEQLKCDNCKCTPTVIHNTPSGRFCEACRPVAL